MKTSEELIEASQREFKEYIRLLNKASEVEGLDLDCVNKKLEILAEANKHYELHEKYEKEYQKMSDKIDKQLGIGKNDKKRQQDIEKQKKK